MRVLVQFLLDKTVEPLSGSVCPYKFHKSELIITMDRLQGEELSGNFRMKPNERNKRDLDFEIDVEFRGELCEMSEVNKYKMR